MIRIGDLYLGQEDRASPTTLAAGSAPGESGVFVLSLRYLDGVHAAGTSRKHVDCFHMSPPVRFEFHMAGRGFELEMST
jgi:AraC family transcriptional regulator